MKRSLHYVWLTAIFTLLAGICPRSKTIKARGFCERVGWAFERFLHSLLSSPTASLEKGNSIELGQERGHALAKGFRRAQLFVALASLVCGLVFEKRITGFEVD